MTAKEIERLTRVEKKVLVVETKVDRMAEDISEIKEMIKAEITAREDRNKFEDSQRQEFVTYKMLGLILTTLSLVFGILGFLFVNLK